MNLKKILFYTGVAGIVLTARCQAQAADGFYVANYGNGSVRGFTDTGLDLGNITTTPVPQAQGIASDSANNIYVVSTSGNYIRRFAPSGADLGVFASTGISDARSLVFDTNGNLYVANVGTATVRRFSPTGVDLGNFVSNELSNPTGMAFDEAGNLYVANYYLNQVKKFSPDGTFLGVAISAGLNQPIGLVVIPQAQGGGFYVANDFASSVIRYDAAGNIVSTLTSGSLGRLGYSTLDAAGNLYVTRMTANAIRKFSPADQDLGDFAVTGLDVPAAIIVRQPDPLTRGLVAHYPFSGNANDTSGNGNNGFPNNATLAADRFGLTNSAYRFNGVNAQILVNDNPALASLGSNYTFIAWAKFATLPNRDMSLLIKSFGAGSGNNKWILWRHVNPPVGIGLLTGAEPAGQWNSEYPLTTNRWYMISVVAAGTNATISVDGATVAVQAGNTSLSDTTGASLSIGGVEPSGNTWFAGDLDEIRIYNRALSEDEVGKIYSLESGPILNLRKAVYFDSTALQVGSKYQVQFSTDVSNWTNFGTAFIATSSNWRSTNYWDVASWDKLFFRVQIVP